jgi:dipeptidyl aminopeptidase/acylaminoacyl peptidase
MKRQRLVERFEVTLNKDKEVIGTHNHELYWADEEFTVRELNANEYEYKGKNYRWSELSTSMIRKLDFKTTRYASDHTKSFVKVEE